MTRLESLGFYVSYSLHKVIAMTAEGSKEFWTEIFRENIQYLEDLDTEKYPIDKIMHKNGETVFEWCLDQFLETQRKTDYTILAIIIQKGADCNQRLSTGEHPMIYAMSKRPDEAFIDVFLLLGILRIKEGDDDSSTIIKNLIWQGRHKVLTYGLSIKSGLIFRVLKNMLRNEPRNEERWDLYENIRDNILGMANLSEHYFIKLMLCQPVKTERDLFPAVERLGLAQYIDGMPSEKIELVATLLQSSIDGETPEERDLARLKLSVLKEWGIMKRLRMRAAYKYVEDGYNESGSWVR